jgi:protein-disulfide isomerase
MNKKIIVISSAIILVLLFIIGGQIYKSQKTKRIGFLAQENASTFVRKYSPTLGGDDAKVFLVKFTDPACETCRAFHPYVKELMKAYRGRIMLVMRYAPFHRGSDNMVRILESARRQGKYWETLEIMYETQPYWASHQNPRPQLIWKYLLQVGLDLEKIRKDMNDPEIEKILQQDLADGKTLGVRKTPGFFVNGKPLTSFGYKQLQELIDSEVRLAYK